MAPPFVITGLKFSHALDASSILVPLEISLGSGMHFKNRLDTHLSILFTKLFSVWTSVTSSRVICRYSISLCASMNRNDFRYHTQLWFDTQRTNLVVQSSYWIHTMRKQLLDIFCTKLSREPKNAIVLASIFGVSYTGRSWITGKTLTNSPGKSWKIVQSSIDMNEGRRRQDPVTGQEYKYAIMLTCDAIGSDASDVKDYAIPNVPTSQSICIYNI